MKRFGNASSAASISGAGRYRALAAAAALLIAAVIGAAASTALAAPPTLTIDPANPVTFNSAQANGHVDPQGLPTTYRFRYIAEATFQENLTNGHPGFEGAPGAGEASTESAETVSAPLTGLTPATTYHLLLEAENGETEAVEAPTFTTDPVNPPSATGLTISAVTASGAHLSATVNSGGSKSPDQDTTYSFQCVEPGPPCPGLAENTPVPTDGLNHVVVEDLSGLQPHKTYDVKLIATNASGPIVAEASFITGALAPDVETLATHGPVSSTTAHLAGQLNPHNSQITECQFEYGTDTTYGHEVPCDSDPGAANAITYAGAELSSLQPATTYHYRLIAANGVGAPLQGSDQTLTTPATPGPPPGECANQAIRLEQETTYLPDCRAYEMISPADKNNSQVQIVSAISTDGTRVLYNTIGGVPGSVSGAHPQLLATRTAAGWVSRDVLAPPAQWPGQTFIPAVLNPEVTAAVESSYEGLGRATTSPDITAVELPFDNTQTILHTFPVFFGGGGLELVASDDLRHILVNAPEPIDPSHQPETKNVYDLGSGSPVLVSALPQTNQAPPCGVFVANNPPGFATAVSSVSEHWISTDGSRAFFLSSGEECSGPLQLYVRDLDTQTTTLISTPPLSGDPDNGAELFLQASPDGSSVIYGTTTSFSPADDLDHDAEDQDLYRWSAASGNICLTCSVANGSESFSQRVAATEDTSSVYFSSADRLYLTRAGTTRFIAPASSATDQPFLGGDVTPDGDVVVFESSEPGLNAITGSDNGGTKQVYRYDDRDHSLTCVSCPTGRPAVVDAEPSLAESRLVVRADNHAVTDDGRSVVFLTAEALLPADVNHAVDIYEWHDGGLHLITSGREHYTRFVIPIVSGFSPDGNDLLFKDTARLLPEAQDSSFKLYDARVGGGFRETASPQPPCQGDSCHGSPSPPPAALASGTDAFTGPASPKPKRKHHKPTKHHKPRRHQGRSSHHNRGGKR